VRKFASKRCRLSSVRPFSRPTCVERRERVLNMRVNQHAPLEEFGKIAGAYPTFRIVFAGPD
jgi:hypothetical protein